VVICLERGADLHMAQLMPLQCYPLSLAPAISRLVLPFWYRLTRVVPDKGPLTGCVCVCSYPILTLDSTVQLSQMFEVCIVSKDLLVLLQASCCSNAVLMYACLFAAFFVFRFLGIFSTQEANGY